MMQTKKCTTIGATQIGGLALEKGCMNKNDVQQQMHNQIYWTVERMQWKSTGCTKRKQLCNTAHKQWQ